MNPPFPDCMHLDPRKVGRNLSAETQPVGQIFVDPVGSIKVIDRIALQTVGLNGTLS